MLRNLAAAWVKTDGSYRTDTLGTPVMDDAIITAKQRTRENETLIVVRDIAQRPLALGVPYVLKFTGGGMRVKYRREEEPFFPFDYLTSDYSGRLCFPLEVDSFYSTKSMVSYEISCARAFKFQDLFENWMARFDNGPDNTISFSVVDPWGRVMGVIPQGKIVMPQKAEWRPTETNLGTKPHQFFG